MAEITAAALVDMIRDLSTPRGTAIRMVEMAMADARRGIRNKAEKIIGNLRAEISNLSLDEPSPGLEPPKWKKVILGDVEVAGLYYRDHKTFRKIGLTSSIEIDPDSPQDVVGQAFAHDPFTTVEIPA